MKKMLLVALVAVLCGFIVAKEFEGFPEVPLLFGHKQSLCKIIMESKDWEYNYYLSTNTVAIFNGRQCAGKDIDGVIMQFKENSLLKDYYLSAIFVQFKNEQDAKEVFQGIIKDYSLEKRGNDYSDGKTTFAIDQCSILMYDEKK